MSHYNTILKNIIYKTSEKRNGRNLKSFSLMQRGSEYEGYIAKRHGTRGRGRGWL